MSPLKRNVLAHAPYVTFCSTLFLYCSFTCWMAHFMFLLNSFCFRCRSCLNTLYFSLRMLWGALGLFLAICFVDNIESTQNVMLLLMVGTWSSRLELVLRKLPGGTVKSVFVSCLHHYLYPKTQTFIHQQWILHLHHSAKWLPSEEATCVLFMVKLIRGKYTHADCNLSMLTDEHDHRELKISFKSQLLFAYHISRRENALFCGNTKWCVKPRG